MDKNKKIIIWTVVIVVIVIVLAVAIYKFTDMKKENSTSEVNNTNSSITEPKAEEVASKKYSNVIEGIKIDLDIPSSWNYEEVQQNNENFVYSLKLYKNDENKYAMLNVYKIQFAVCGTDRTTEKMTLNNGKEAVVGYYNNSDDWWDISFYSMNNKVAVINEGLTGEEAKELKEIIKSINIE